MVYFKIEIGLGRRVQADLQKMETGCHETDGWTAATAEMERLKAAGRYKTAANYLTAIRSWSHYLGDNRWRFAQMTADEMACFQRWLTADQGLCLNTVSAYMRCLRALYNKVMGLKNESAEDNPFIHVFTGRSRTRKRSATADVLQRLKNLPLADEPSLAMARDLFLFGFMAMGMPFVDMAYLRTEQVADGIIRYTRHKTGQPINVPISSQMESIMQRYADSQSVFVFPILDGSNSANQYRHYRHALRRYNRALQLLSDRIGAQPRLSSYVVRHTWASLAYQHHLSIEQIGKGLGHTKVSTTMIYIKNLFDKDLAEANDAMLKELGL